MKQRNRSNKKPFQQASEGKPEENPDLKCPVFSFKNMQMGSGYSVECCIQDDQAALARRLFKLSQMTWRAIRQADRHGLGFEKISRDSLKIALPQHITDDANIIAFRFNGKKPMLGYREGRVFNVLVLDHSFSAYNHG